MKLQLCRQLYLDDEKKKRDLIETGLRFDLFRTVWSTLLYVSMSKLNEFIYENQIRNLKYVINTSPWISINFKRKKDVVKSISCMKTRLKDEPLSLF